MHGPAPVPPTLHPYLLFNLHQIIAPTSVHVRRCPRTTDMGCKIKIWARIVLEKRGQDFSVRDALLYSTSTCTEHISDIVLNINILFIMQNGCWISYELWIYSGKMAGWWECPLFVPEFRSVYVSPTTDNTQRLGIIKKKYFFPAVSKINNMKEFRSIIPHTYNRQERR